MTRVLHVDTATEWRGGQQQLAYLLRGRAGDAWAGVVDSPLAARVRAPEVALLRGNDPRNVWRLWRAFRVGGWDLAAAHTSHALDACLLAGLPVVAHRRVDFSVRHGWKYRRANGVIAVSEAVSGVLARAGVASVVVHDGVELPADEGPSVEDLLGKVPRPWVAALGALVPHKGHAVLVEALRAVPGTLILAGEGPLRGELVAMAERLGLRDRVRFVGHIERPGRLLRSVDLLVHPSLEEGLGQIVLEARALGVRVVASDAGGLPEAMGGLRGCVPHGDAAALARAMSVRLSEPRPAPMDLEAAGFSAAAMCAATGAAYASFRAPAR